ncbi:Single-stranded DNA-specific exonuclease, DHH superfamily, may be involved in DNA replication intiation [Nitrosospira briensis]|uniref:Single-stranded DNA-specific exonuclease, DHH superfamily, may be involved in DNA replication intiation n=1 Tax=Nitrosospira briensis TaxID=35799 RepID=A0A1I4XG75_9PROT|nr:acetyltransferase [Nitrosospira briensis]SFN24300.1 Single-stranded DNA-specific exonuclease, DHH superfamily, may be involved in DNA replication intiation [Nitrosospira briensis]
MSRYYVFNGDADGLCALHQLRLADPSPAELVTGVKRDIKLLDRVQAGAGDCVTVLDVSLNSNRQELMRLLDAGANVEYFDHHYAGEIPHHHNLAAHIDVSAEVCTSILVDRHLQGKYRLWAIVAAFGDNLGPSARTLAEAVELAEAQIEKLAQLGEYLNYNGYGETVEDLHFHPAELYGEIKPYPDPFVFIAESAAFARLAAGFRDDIVMVDSLCPLLDGIHYAAYLLPDASWARRVSGVFANRLANDNPCRAHAVITHSGHGDYSVSVRASKANPQGADSLCMKFETGGGRKAAAGINRLPTGSLDRFLALFAEQFG